jgi:hypothetical protein
MQLRRQSVLWQSDLGLARINRALKERRAPLAGDYFQKRTAYEYFKTVKSGLGGLVALSTRLKSRAIGLTSARSLLQRQLDFLLYPTRKLVAQDETCTGVPAQQRIVVFGWTKRFGLFVPTHRFKQ